MVIRDDHPNGIDLDVVGLVNPGCTHQHNMPGSMGLADIWYNCF